MDSLFSGILGCLANFVDVRSRAGGLCESPIVWHSLNMGGPARFYQASGWCEVPIVTLLVHTPSLRSVDVHGMWFICVMYTFMGISCTSVQVYSVSVYCKRLALCVCCVCVFVCVCVCCREVYVCWFCGCVVFVRC